MSFTWFVCGIRAVVIKSIKQRFLPVKSFCWPPTNVSFTFHMQFFELQWSRVWDFLNSNKWLKGRFSQSAFISPALLWVTSLSSLLLSFFLFLRRKTALVGAAGLWPPSLILHSWDEGNTGQQRGGDILMSNDQKRSQSS